MVKGNKAVTSLRAQEALQVVEVVTPRKARGLVRWAGVVLLMTHNLGLVRLHKRAALQALRNPVVLQVRVMTTEEPPSVCILAD